MKTFPELCLLLWYPFTMGCATSINTVVNGLIFPLTPQEINHLQRDFGELAKLLLLSQANLVSFFQKVGQETQETLWKLPEIFPLHSLNATLTPRLDS
jgi:hypothetical protein